MSCIDVYGTFSGESVCGDDGTEPGGLWGGMALLSGDFCAVPIHEKKGESFHYTVVVSGTGIQTKEVYRSSAINELPEGVFVMDHQRNLIRVNSPEEAEKIVDNIMGKNTSQAGRHRIVKEAAKSWFEYHGKAAEAKKASAETVKEENVKEENVKEVNIKEVETEAVEKAKEVTSGEAKKESSETTEKTEQEKESEKEIEVPELDGFFL